MLIKISFFLKIVNIFIMSFFKKLLDINFFIKVKVLLRSYKSTLSEWYFVN